MKIGVIQLDSLEPKFLAKKSKNLQTVNELMCDDIRNRLQALIESANTALSARKDKAFVDHLDPVIELAVSIDEVRSGIDLSKPETQGHIFDGEYSIVIDNRRSIVCVMESTYSSRGKMMHPSVKDSIDMSIPSTDGEECYVLGPEWFPGKVPPYDIHRLRQVGATTPRRKKRRAASSAADPE